MGGFYCARQVPACAVVMTTISLSSIDGDALTFIVVAPPSQGTVTLNPQIGAFTYKPNKNVTGLDVFSFQVTDGAAQSSGAWVVIAINK